jgi:tetratricopeptide (TPR) repeat protein
LHLPNRATLQWLSKVIDMSITLHGNEFGIRRIEREAQAILEKARQQPEMYWLILAFTAFLRGERTQCIRCIEAAHALAKHDVMILGNAASLLNNIGMPRLAVDYARRLVANVGDDARIKVNAARVFYSALHFEDAASIVYSPENHGALTEKDAFFESLPGILARFDDSEVDLGLRLALLESAISAICAEGCVIRQTTAVHYPDNSMRYELFVDQCASRCASVNIAIADTLTECFENAHPEVITFACRPFHAHTHPAFS